MFTSRGQAFQTLDEALRGQEAGPADKHVLIQRLAHVVGESQLAVRESANEKDEHPRGVWALGAGWLGRLGRRGACRLFALGPERRYGLDLAAVGAPVRQVARPLLRTAC